MMQKLSKYSKYMMKRNVQSMLERTPDFNIDDIYSGLKYNYRGMNYFVAQGKGRKFRFFALSD